MADSNLILNLIQQQVPRTLESAKTVSDTRQANAKAGEQVASEVEQIYKQIANDAALVTRTQQLGTMRAQQINQDALLAAGVNPATGANQLVDLITQINRTGSEAQQTLEQVIAEEQASVGFSPVQAFKNAVDWNGTRTKLKGQVQSLELADKRLGQLNTALSETARTTAATAQTITNASIEASSRVAAAEWEIRARQARMEGLKYNNEQVTAAAELDEKQLAMMYQVRNAQMNEQQHQLALQQFDFAKERFNWEREARALAQQERQVGKTVDAMVLDRINMSLRSLGQEEITGPMAQTQIELFKKGASQELEYHYRNGTRIQTTGISMVGATPAESAEVLTKIPANLPETRKQTAQIIMAAQKALGESKDIRLQDPKNTQGRAAFVNKTVGDIVSQQYSSIAPGSGNIFDIGDLSSYIGTASNPGIQKLQMLPLVQKVLNPAIAAGQPLSDPKMVFGLATAAVQKGVISSSQASADLVNLYRQANVINQAARGFTGFGIVPPNNGMNYYSKFGGFGDTLDMTDFTAVAREMNKAMAQKAFESYRTQSLGIRRAITGNSPGVQGQ